jgi:hypothetical protein
MPADDGHDLCKTTRPTSPGFRIKHKWVMWGIWEILRESAACNDFLDFSDSPADKSR